MEAISGLVGTIAFIAFIAFAVTAPSRKERARQNRIRQDAFIRGQGYWQGKYSVVQPPQPLPQTPAAPAPEGWAPIVPVQVHNATGFKALMAIVVLAIGAAIAWMAYDVGRHHAQQPAGATLTTEAPKVQPRRKANRRVGPAVQNLADATCLSTGSVPATDGKCYGPKERMPQGVSRRIRAAQDVLGGTKPLPGSKDAP